jgi:peptidoglycan/xylan/chitin deacetylase (PgdA/CDA1 family)
MRRQILCSLDRREVPLENREPIVSFSFDDFPRSAYSVGGSILEHFGTRGTFYTAYGLINTCNELGDHFRLDDLDSLLDRGHELASHTYGHLSARSVSCEAFCQDVEKGRQAIEKVTGSESLNFAYPFGHVTLRAKQALGKPALGKRALGLNLASARGIFPGFNGPKADLNLLRANSLYGDLDGAGRVEELIAENCRRKSWLIFYTHDVRPNPSPYGCTPALLEAAASCAAQSGCRILTVREAMRDAGIQNGSPDPHARQCVSS